MIDLREENTIFLRWFSRSRSTNKNIVVLAQILAQPPLSHPATVQVFWSERDAAQAHLIGVGSRRSLHSDRSAIFLRIVRQRCLPPSLARVTRSGLAIVWAFSILSGARSPSPAVPLPFASVRLASGRCKLLRPI